MALTDAQAKIIAENKRKKEEEEARKKAALKAAEKALNSTKTGSAVQSPLKKMTATGFRPGALASQEVKKATKKAAEPARQKAIQDAQDALANARDRRSRAAANQRLRDAKYPLTGRDAELSTVDKLEIQRAKERWERVDRLEKEHGASDYTRRLKREAHNQAESIRVRHGYTGGTDGSEHTAPILNAEDRKGSKAYQENLAMTELYKSMARDNGNFALYNWAQEQEDILRGVKSEGGNESAISWVDKIPQDREYLEGEVTKAQEALKAAQDALRSFRSNGSLHAQDSLRRLQENVEQKKAALEEAERRVARVDYAESFQDLTYQEDGSKWNDFWVQFNANRNLGRITQDTSKAYNEFLENPTAANRAYAWAMAELEREFQERNAGALDDEGQVLPWLSDTFAGYLPQFADQFKAGMAGAAAGGLTGAGIGFAAGGIGAIPGFMWGSRAGAVAGSGKYSYDTMRGAAYRQLVESGVDEATAREAAGDEAVISALIEMADTGVDIFTLGIGSALKMAGKGAAEAATKSAGKKLATALGKYGLNIGSEMGQEFSQQAVSIANQYRDDTGLWDLAKETWGVTRDAVTGENPEAWDQMTEAAKEGGKIAAIMGGAGMVGSAAVNKGLEKGFGARAETISDKDLGKRVKAQGDEAIRELVEEGYASEETAYLAAPVATKLQKGETPSDQEVGRLARALRGEEQTQEAQEEADEEIVPEESARETTQESAEEAQAATFAAPREVVAEEQSAAPVAAESALEGGEDIVMQAAREMTAPKPQEASKAAKGLGYGRHGTQAFERILDSGDMTVEEAKMRFQSAYEAGLTNAPRERVSLLNGIQEQAYNAGRQDYILTLDKAKKPVKYTPVFRGKYVDDQTTDGVNETYKAKIGVAAQELDMKVVLVDSLGKRGNSVIGGYMTESGELVVAMDALDPLEVVTKHEVTHRLQKLAPKAYLAFRNFAVEQMSKDLGYAGTTYVERVQRDYAEGGVNLTTEQAMDEIAAEFAGQVLFDEKIRKAVAEKAAQDEQTRTTMEKFWQAVREFIQKVKKAFRGDKAKMDEEAVETYGLTIEELERGEKLWREAYKEAAKAVAEGRESATEAGGQTEGKAAASMKIGDEAAVYEEGGKRFSIKSLNHDIAEGKMFSDLVEAGVFTKAQATRLKNNLSKLIEYMVPNANILDMNEDYGKGNRPFKAYKPNSDPLYVISLDFSTLCRKRLMTQYVIEQLQLRENRPMTAEEQIAIRSMLLDYRKQEKALQVACAMCYVEAARLKAPKQMETYFKTTEQVLTKYFAMKNKAFNDGVKKAQEEFKVKHGYKAKDPKSAMSGAHKKAFDQMSDRMRRGYTPTAEEQAIIEQAKGLPRSTYLTAANLTELSVKHPAIYDAYTTYIRNATRSKSLESDIPYYYGDSNEAVTDGFIEKVNAENGMRFDSWSDFQMQHMLDMITAVIDLSVRGSKMHGYTKFPEMVRIFGKTGMQFNLSGVTEGNGFDENGELVFSSIEGMSKEDAIRLRKDFPETAGFQCIGVSDEHIRALLRADYIDYVIPYHISGLNKTMRRMAGIYQWDDYSLVQHAKKDPKARKPDGAENWQVEPVWSEFYVGEGKDGLDIMRKTAQKYIDMCHERGMIPKFNDFTDEDGYWKLLVDRKMINQKTGKIIEQKPVRPDFDFKLIKQEIDREVAQYDPSLEQRALDYVVKNFDAVNTRIQELKKQGTLVNQKQKTRKQMKTLGNEILQAYAQGTKEQPAPARESLEGVQFSLKQKDKDYLTAVERGDMKTAQKMVDEAAKAAGYDSPKLYHGTQKFGFTALDVSQSDDQISFFATSDPDVARTYSGSSGARGVSEDVDYDRVEEIKDSALNEVRELVLDLYNEISAEFPYSVDYMSMVEEFEEYAHQVADGNISFEEADFDLYDTYVTAVMEHFYGEDEDVDFAEWQDTSLEWQRIDEKLALAINSIYAYAAACKNAENAGNYALYGNVSNFFDVDCNGAVWNRIEMTAKNSSRKVWTTRHVAEYAYVNNYSGIRFKNIIDEGNKGPGVGKPSDVYVFFDPQSQIKSADPVTYDDSGMVIPLSERFSEGNPDIRFSMKKDSQGNRLSPGQVEYFKDSKVRNEDGELIRLYHGTMDFGFTEFDPGKSDDGLSFFMTDDLEVAGSYSGSGLVRSVYDSQANKIRPIDPFTAPIESVVEEYNAIADNEITLLSSKEQIMEWADRHMAWAKREIKRSNELLGNLFDGLEKIWDTSLGKDRSMAEEAIRAFKPFREAYHLAENATTAEELLAAANALEDVGRNATVADVDKSNFLYHSFVPGFSPLLVSQDLSTAGEAVLAAEEGRKIIASGQDYTLGEKWIRQELDNLWNYQDVEEEANYELYANLTNPLIIEADGAHWNHIRIPADIDLEDFRKHTGFARTKPFARTRELAAYARAYNYDGVIFRDLIDIGSEGWQDIASTVVIAFDSSQIKDAYNRNPTSDPDFRFSMKAQKDLMKENAKLREVNAALKAQFKTTTFAKVDKKALDRFTKDLLKDYASDADMGEIRRMLDEVFTYLANGETEGTSWTEAQRRAFETAATILANASTLDDEMYKQYSDLRKHLRTTAISISEEYAGDLVGYESIEEFRRANFGRLKITKDGTPVDVVFQELAVRYPEFFDETGAMNPADQLLAIAEVLDQLQPTEVNPYSHNMREAATWLASDILKRVFELPQAKPTFADKAQDKLTRQIIKDREKLEKLREQKNERIAEIIEENRKKLKETQAKEKVKREEAVRKVKDHYKAKEAKSSESRKARELRGKIIRHVKQLDEKLLTNSDKKHIPYALREAVATMLGAINRESGYSYDPATMHQVIRKDGKNGGMVGKHVPKDQGVPTARTKAFQELRLAYEKILSEADQQMVIDPDLVANIQEMEALKDTPIGDLSVSQLTTMWNTIKAVEASITSYNKMFGQQKFETIREVADGLKADNAGKRDRGDYRGPIGAMDKLINAGMLTPESFFHRLGKTGESLFRMLRGAQDKHIGIMQEAQKYTHDLIGKTDIGKLEKNVHHFDFDGKTIDMTTAQIMSLYELMKRQQAVDHIVKGGIRVEGIKKGLKKKGMSDAVKITVEEVSEIVSTLTEEQRTIADGLQNFMGHRLSQLGNEASMEVYGYEKFKEKNYFPIKVDSNQTVTDQAKDAAAATIAGRGFTKGTTPHANNALMVRNIFDVYADHVTDMATYSSWLAPMENLQRVFNFKYRDEEGDLTGTVKGLVHRVYGQNGEAYWKKLTEDLNNGVHGTNDNPFQTLIGNYKASVIGANIRVFIQQPTSILRALDSISPADFMAGLIKANPNTWKKVKEYAPIAVWKDWGYFDADTGRQMKAIMFGDDSGIAKVNNALMAPAGAMDSLAWSHIWNALEVETARKHKNLQKGSDAFYKKVAERFNEVVDHTQVVDGILQRSQVMRSPDGVTKMATSFMAEPTKIFNMFTTAAYDLRKSQDNAFRKKARKTMARTSVALFISFVANAAAQSLVDAFRDDDKDEEYWEKFFQAFVGLEGDEETKMDKAKSIASGNMGKALNPFGYLPFVKDVVSLIEGYDVARMDMESISNVVSAVGYCIKSLNGEGKMTPANALINLAAELSRFLGTPVSNIKRDVMAGINTWLNLTDNYKGQYAVAKTLYDINYTGNKGMFLDIAYLAWRDGDKETFVQISQDLMDAFPGEVNGQTIESAMKSRTEKQMEEDSEYKPTQTLEDLIGILPEYAEEEEKEEEFSAKSLNAEQYNRFMQKRASSYRKYEDAVTGSSVWDDLDDKAKDKVISQLWKYATQTALEDVSGGKFVMDDSTMVKAKNLEKNHQVDPGIFFTLYGMTNVLESDTTVDGETIDDSLGYKKLMAVRDSGLLDGYTDEQQDAVYGALDIGAKLQSMSEDSLANLAADIEEQKNAPSFYVDFPEEKKDDVKGLLETLGGFQSKYDGNGKVIKGEGKQDKIKAEIRARFNAGEYTAHQCYLLFHEFYSSDKNNPWAYAKYG